MVAILAQSLVHGIVMVAEMKVLRAEVNVLTLQKVIRFLVVQLHILQLKMA